MAKKKNLISRLIEGPERSESYARSTLPTNRWELGWDVFKTNKGKLVGLNLLTMIFLLPFLFLLLFRYVNKISMISVYPFGQNLAGGYPYFPLSAGLESQVEIAVNQQFFLYVIIAVAIASVGISGGFYVMRSFVWTESVSVGGDFIKGVKNNFFIVFFSLILYSLIVAVTVLSINVSSYLIATGQGVKWLLIVQQAVSYLLLAFLTVMELYMITVGINYKLKFFQLIKNSFILTVALFPFNVFFILFGAVFFLLLLIGFNFITVIAVLGCLLIGISMFMLVWTDYSHWVFDKYINDRVAGAKKNRGIYKPNAVTEEESDYKPSYSSKAVKPVTDYDVEIYELPTSFSRKDLEKLEETKEAMRKDSDKYAEEHTLEEKDAFSELLEKQNSSEDNKE